MNEIYGILKDGVVQTWTMQPQTEGEFVVCDINDLPNKKVVNGVLKNLTATEKKKRDDANWMQNRVSEYGSIDSQLDEIYHDFNSWKSRIEAVKLKYPKP